ncbi:MAG: hypothetical protein AB8F94_20425 [Saprospiraceae bacterium]
MHHSKKSRLENFIQQFGIYFIYLSALVLTFLVRENFFFWDTVQLGSIHGQFYFDNNFSSFFLPENIDSGHPPTFGIYIALVWKIFGKSLVASHSAMLPFLFGIIFYLEKLGKYFFQNSIFTFAFILLLIVDPCLAGQAVLVTPDIVVVFFFLMSLEGIFNKKRKILVIGIIGLCLISMRGIMVAAAIFSLDFLNYFFVLKKEIKFKSLFVNTLPYLFGVGLGLSFLLFHYLETGWIGYHENSPWAPAFEKVDRSGALKNIVVLGWRLLDFGRIFLWLILLILSVNIFRKKPQLDLKTQQLLILFSTLIFFLTPALIIHKMLLGHRYLLPIFLIIDFIAVYFIFKYVKKREWKIGLFLVCLVGLSLGNFWVYPKKISQGWDSTLAHLPYYKLRNDMIEFIEKEKIPFEKIGSAFPNLLSIKNIDLKDTEKHFEEKNLSEQEYIFYSNVFNDFTDEEIDDLEKNWKVVKELKKQNVCVILYQKNK